jgi:hypothetical protein
MASESAGVPPVIRQTDAIAPAASKISDWRRTKHSRRALSAVNGEAGSRSQLIAMLLSFKKKPKPKLRSGRSKLSAVSTLDQEFARRFLNKLPSMLMAGPNTPS